MSVLKTRNSPHRLTGLPGCAIITKHATTPSMYPTHHELIPGEVQERHLTLGPAVVVALELPMHRGNQLARYLQRGC